MRRNHLAAVRKNYLKNDREEKPIYRCMRESCWRMKEQVYVLEKTNIVKMSEISMQEMSEESNLKLSEKTILGCQKEVSLFIVFDKSKL